MVLGHGRGHWSGIPYSGCLNFYTGGVGVSFCSSLLLVDPGMGDCISPHCGKRHALIQQSDVLQTTAETRPMPHILHRICLVGSFLARSIVISLGQKPTTEPLDLALRLSLWFYFASPSLVSGESQASHHRLPSAHTYPICMLTSAWSAKIRRLHLARI
jgi:hypothetical protein